MKTLLIEFEDEEDAEIVREALAGQNDSLLGECLRLALRDAKLLLDSKDGAKEVLVERGGDETVESSDKRIGSGWMNGGSATMEYVHSNDVGFQTDITGETIFKSILIN
jgi:hypothetical protein